MDPVTRLLMQGAAGAGANLYVEDVFSTYLYTGNSSTQTITNGIDLSGEGGLVWTKSRSMTSNGNHRLIDTVRGAGYSLISDLTSGQAFDLQTISSFGSTGYSIGTDAQVNFASQTFASWTFRKAPKFFDVVTYTGNGASSRNIPHSLESQPAFIIVKRTDSTGDWAVDSLAWSLNVAGGNPNSTGLLNSTAAFSYTGAFAGPWCNGSTSTNFLVANNTTANINGATYVAYLFASDAGGFGDSGNDSVVKCGSFGTNASGGVTGEVTLDWEPQWVMMKCSSAASNWIMVDVMRGFSQTGFEELDANTYGAAVQVSGNNIYPTATGFVIANATLSGNQAYIYIAIRRGPMKTPESGTEVFSMVDRPGTSAPETVTGFTHPIDTLIVKGKVNGFPANFFDRLRGATRHLDSASPYAEITNANTLTGFDVQTGYTVGSDNYGYGINYAPGGNYINWAFRRAPGFFDVVAYTGDSVFGKPVYHSLGVIPEMIIVKRRSGTENWAVYHNGLPFMDFGGQFIRPAVRLNESTPASTTINTWAVYENTFAGPQSTYFAVNANLIANNSGDTYIAYLFATLTRRQQSRQLHRHRHHAEHRLRVHSRRTVHPDQAHRQHRRLVRLGHCSRHYLR
jgi:hypothetical protein